MLESWEDCRIG